MSTLADKKDCDMWNKLGLNKYVNLGKIRSNSCASGNFK